jgi:putative spermidine/putrescine transport system permease protein
MFAFLASMDDYPISIFFTDAWTKTLPIQMLQYMEESPDPIIAVISTGLILLAVLAPCSSPAGSSAGVGWRNSEGTP